MRPTKSRLRLWMLLLMVAVTGLGFGAVQILQRAADYRRLAVLHQALLEQAKAQAALASVTLERTEASAGKGLAIHPKRLLEEQYEVARSQATVDREAQLMRKYREAAARPWRSVDLEPFPHK